MCDPRPFPASVHSIAHGELWRRWCGLTLRALGVTLPALCLFPQCALATNGLDLTGYGTESSGMGGADVAVARDSLSINTNPAGLTQIRGRAFDIYASPFWDWNRHEDSYGNDRMVSDQYGAIFGGAYAQHLQGTPLSFGAGLFVQGGTGYHYTDLETAFGTRDEASAQFTVIKLAPGLAWRVNERLSLGLNAGLVYSALREAQFPNTSSFDPGNPAASFFGVRLQGGKGFSPSARIGMMYRCSDVLSLGLSYAPKTRLPVSGASLSLDESAAGLGTVTYRDTVIRGLALPQEVSLGLALRPRSDWLLSVELKWLEWSGSIRTLTLDAHDPDTAQAPYILQLPTRLDFRDQLVAAMGVAYRWSEAMTLRAGVNYARRPIPDQNLSPTFAVIQAPHFMAGISHRISAQWELGSAVEYEPPQVITYTNPQQVFGPNAQERTSNILLHLMVSRRW